MTCDADACRAVVKGRRVSFLRRPEALREECGWADMILSERSVEKAQCPKALVYDRSDVRASGALAFYVEGGAIRVRAAEQGRRQRPWNR